MIKYLSGKEDIKRVFDETLQNNENKLLITALSDKPLVYLLGDDFAQEYMSKRKELKIFLKSLRFSREIVDSFKHQDYASYYKEARIAPVGMSIDDSVIIWNDCVAIINSETLEGIIIYDAKNTKLMKQWFDFIWGQSKA